MLSTHDGMRMDAHASPRIHFRPVAANASLTANMARGTAARTRRKRVRPPVLPKRDQSRFQQDGIASIGGHCDTHVSDERRFARPIKTAPPQVRTTATCTPIPIRFAHRPAAFPCFLIHDIKSRLNCFQSVSYQEELIRRQRIQMPSLTNFGWVRSARFACKNRDISLDSAACGNSIAKSDRERIRTSKSRKRDENLH